MIDSHQHFWQVGRFDYPWMTSIALELFGAERMMFGSDYPVCLLAATYDRVLDSFQEVLQYLSNADREKIFSQNAAKFYRVGDV